MLPMGFPLEIKGKQPWIRCHTTAKYLFNLKNGLSKQLVLQMHLNASLSPSPGFHFSDTSQAPEQETQTQSMDKGLCWKIEKLESCKN